MAYRRILFWLALAFALAGCSPWISPSQVSSAGSASLEAGKTTGQTFHAEMDGLSGIDFFLAPRHPGSGEIRLHMRRSPGDKEDIAVSRLSIQSISKTGAYRFSFPVQEGSRGQDYYVFLETHGEGTVNILLGDASSYVDGAFYENHQPASAQSTFRLVYDPPRAAIGLARQSLTWLAFLGMAAFLFLLPGWGLASSLLPAWEKIPWIEKMALSVGVGLAIYPLLFLWASLASLRPGALYAWLPPLAGGAILIWRNRGKLLSWREWKLPGAAPADLAIPFVLAVIFATRFWTIRGIEIPLWGDSLQHTVMAQRMIESGGLFSSWQPYASYKGLIDQFGFSSWIALWAWLSRFGSPAVTLLGGQVINGLAVFTLLPLALRISRGNRWAGAGALLAAGLLSPAPGIYVNWGRYAQLAGQAILPVALWLLWEAIPNKDDEIPVSPGSRLGLATLAGVSLAGMMLSYYRMPFYYGSFAVALLVWALIQKLSFRQWRSFLISWGIVAAIAGILFLPWAAGIFTGKGGLAGEGGSTSGSITARVLTDYQTWLTAIDYIHLPVLALALLGLAWSLMIRRWEAAILAIWTALLASLVALNLIHFPGASLMQNFSVIISLYLPIGLAAGWLIGELARLLAAGKEPAGDWATGSLLAFACLAVLALATSGEQRRIAHPSFYALVTHPDLKAMVWIRQNTPQEARFLVEGFRLTSFGGKSAVGADAGWWIPLLGERANTMPPQYAMLNEAPDPPDYNQQLIQLITTLEKNPPGSPEGMRELCRWQISYVFIGQGQGQVSYGNNPLFRFDSLDSSPDFRLVYRQDRVSIFALQPGACEAAP